IVAAAFSREVVNRRFRTLREDDDTWDEVDARVPEHALAVPVGGPPAVTRGTSAVLIGAGRASGNGQDTDDWDNDWDEDDDETEARRLRKSAIAEVIIAIAVLAVTALLVNAAPARSVQTQPVAMTLKSSKVWVDVVIAPGVAGGNDIHLTALPVGNTVVNV